MKIGVKNKKLIISIGVVLVLLLVSLLIYKNVRADQYANQIAMKTVSITKLDTGLGDFDSTDNLSDDSSITNYIEGNDSSKENRIVRSFDKLTYYFDFSIKGKNVASDYSERVVNIKVTLDENAKNYVSFDPDIKAGDATHTFSFNNIDSYNNFQKTISLYVLNAPNGLDINPKFEIYESTNTDPNSIVTLGKTTEQTNYAYDSDSTNQYNSQAPFTNYFPTVVSSKNDPSIYDLEILPQTEDGQQANYNDETGRYLTFTLGLVIKGNSTKGIKGLTLPNGGDIKIPFTITQNGVNNSVTVDNSWARLYSPNSVASIEPIKVNHPYSKDAVSSVKAPGNVTLEGSAANYTLTIKNYGATYNRPTSTATGTTIDKSKHYYGTYAVSVFSPRSTDDRKNDITVQLSTSAFNVPITAVGTQSASIPAKSASAINKYYENSDYILEGEFYDKTGSKLATKKGTGSVSKGTSLNYKTTFNYKKTLSDQGLKEVIKIDPNAFRVVPFNDKKQVNITLVSENGKINEDDFEVKFVTGSFDNANYSIGTNSRISSNDASIVTSTCESKNISTLNQNQIQNLYGGPCIKAKDNVENEYSKIEDAKTKVNGKEIENPITKIIIQTKKGVKLPDSVKVIVDVALYVKNVGDLSQTYQATVLASTSDYDNELVYYTPSVDSSESVLNENNYTKTVYAYRTPTTDNNSPWGDSLKIVNFTSRQAISVKNRNQDGTVKTNYNVKDNETLNYVIKTNINDDSVNVGADDTWYINYLKVTVNIPKELNYVSNNSSSNYSLKVVNNSDGSTTLVYMLPFTKPNQAIKDILFDATIKPNISGTGVEIPVTSSVDAININGEEDLSYFGHLTDSFSIFASGTQNVILSQKIGNEGTVHEPNSEFSYILTGYNNTASNITDYNIVDVLPYNGDSNGSKINGKYKVKVTLSPSLASATVLCSNEEPSKLSNEVFNKNNIFKECNVESDYVDASAIYIKNISINAGSYLDEIKVSIKPTDNKYSNEYINMFRGASEAYPEMESNKIKSRIVSRNISGKVFMDMNEDGIHEENDKMMSNLPVELYKVESDGKLKKVLQTTTDKNGKYKFKDLDSAAYKVRISYDSEKFDLTNRYQTEDSTLDSDAYKIKDGLAEIAFVRNLDDKDTKKDSLEELKVTKDIESAGDLDMGLINRKNFGFDMSKYITKIDLNYNNSVNTLNYDNQSKVSISVKNSLKATAKVYYGITLTNNSSTAGYAKLVQEDIPNGLIFDPNDPYNSEWFMTDGSVQSTAYSKELIKPGESRYLKIVLNMPRQLQATTFINTVSMLEVEPYKPTLAPDKLADEKSYQIGEEVSYGGLNWHVINVAPSSDGDLVTLFSDTSVNNNSISGRHLSSQYEVYKWSESYINKALNNNWIKTTSLDPSILVDNYVCDDTLSGGGSLKGQSICTNNVYTSSKVRLLTSAEFTSLYYDSSLTDKSWLSGSYWLMNSGASPERYNSYGQVTDNSLYEKTKAVFVSNFSAQPTYGINTYSVRPVITISSKNLITE